MIQTIIVFVLGLLYFWVGPPPAPAPVPVPAPPAVIVFTDPYTVSHLFVPFLFPFDY